MSGELNPDKLLETMDPSLSTERYVFVTGVPESSAARGVRPIMTFREREGETWVVTEEEAAQLGECRAAFTSRMITLNVHSSLEAVGFLARITDALAKNGISVNAASAFYHDYLFVPESKAGQAMEVLRALSAAARQSVE
ncbi:MAG TPA: ACT domain-containing protein [Steroidobacteraceae bacterium]